MYLSMIAHFVGQSHIDNFAGFKSIKSVKPLVDSREKLLPQLREARKTGNKIQEQKLHTALRKLAASIVSRLREERLLAAQPTLSTAGLPTSPPQHSAEGDAQERRRLTEQMQKRGLLPATT